MRKTASAAILLAVLGLTAAGCDIAPEPVRVTAQPVTLGGTTVVRTPQQSPEAALEPAAGGAGAASEAERPPAINVYLVCAKPDRPRCLMQVHDFVCGTWHTWPMGAGKAEEVIAICADERGLGHAEVRVADAKGEDAEWVEYSDIAERDVLKR
jgi:hypothetical protein